MNSLARICSLLLASAFTSVVLAASKAEQAGLDRSKLAEIPRRMQQFVDEGQIAGAVTLVARNGEIASLEAAGYSDLTSRRKMRTDDLFWIASMTKPITATAIMMLQDEGKLSVEEAVEKHLPEFKNQWMIQSKSGASLSLERAPRPITLRDLLTHTSGIGEMAAPRLDSSLAELAVGYSQQPLRFPPGSKWEYSNAGINTLGRIVEIVSGQRFADFVERRIFKPLEMKDTTFWPSERQVQRLAKSYQPAKSGGGLEETEIFLVQGNVTARKRAPIPAGGLFSTARDLQHFYQMALNGGTYQGQRMLSESAIAQMTHTQTGDIKTGFVDGMSFGFGYAVVKEPRGVTGRLSAGTFGHGGAYGTQGWVDPQRKLIMILLIQRAKLPNADASPMRASLHELAVGAIQ